MTSEKILWILAMWAARATALAVAAGLLLWLLRIKDASLRLVIWTGVLLGVLAMPAVSFLAPPLSIAIHRTSTTPTATAGIPEISQANPLLRPSPSHRARLTWETLAVALWATVVAAMILRLGAGFASSRRIIAASREIETGVRESSEITVPITLGILHPVVILPAGWRQWQPDKLKMVLAHERAHVHRRDPLRRMTASLYRALCWFHPLAWWLWAHLAALAEAASDDAALAAVPNHALYAETLLGFFRLMPRRVKWEGVAMSSANKVTSRIERVLDVRRTLSGVMSRRALAGVVLAVLPLIYLAASAKAVWVEPSSAPLFAQSQPAAMQTAVEPSPATPSPKALPQASALAPASVRKTAQSAAPEHPASQATPGDTMCGGNKVYSRWLNEDVRYIITSPERAALESLKDANECDVFVEQFWSRRNPVPGSPLNAFKTEHYHRIAYANGHFGSSTELGWLSARGRTYITYGPPDETQVPPDAGPGSPKEAWIYQHVLLNGAPVKLTVEFIDEAAEGSDTTHVVIDLENPK